MSGGDYSSVERRRSGRAAQAPMTTLTQLPALVVLQWLPDPVLAVWATRVPRGGASGHRSPGGAAGADKGSLTKLTPRA